MRSATVAVAGAAMIGAAYMVSRSSEGILQAASFMLALFLIPVTAGIALTVRPRPWRSPTRHRGDDAERCGVCGSPVEVSAGARLCPTCDRTAR